MGESVDGLGPRWPNVEDAKAIAVVMAMLVMKKARIVEFM
jgi:hypothetical protein